MTAVAAPPRERPTYAQLRRRVAELGLERGEWAGIPMPVEGLALHIELLDMQVRGYAIMVRQDDGTYARAVAINRETKSYVVIPPAPEPSAGDADAVQEKPKRGRRRAEQSVSGRKAVGVARSAGGCHVRSPFELLRLARS